MTSKNAQRAPEGYMTMAEAIAASPLSKSTFYEYVTAKKIAVETLSFQGKERRFVSRAELCRVFGKESGNRTESEESGKSEVRIGPDGSGVPEESELVRLRTENAVLQARLEAAQEAQKTAERDKESYAHMLKDSLETVKFLELRSSETAKLLALREDHQPGQDEKKPGWLARLFRR